MKGSEWASLALSDTLELSVRRQLTPADDALLLTPLPGHQGPGWAGRPRCCCSPPAARSADCFGAIMARCEWPQAVMHQWRGCRERGGADRGLWRSLAAVPTDQDGQSELLLVAVKGLEWRPRSQGVTFWPVVTRLLAAVLQGLVHGGIVLQEPTLHAMLPKALSAHEPLHSQVPLLAKGGQLLTR